MKIETSPKRVRAYLGGHALADSVRAKLVWEVPHYPAYYFPASDVRAEMLVENGRTRGGARYLDARVGDRVVEDAAWRYPDSPHAEIRDHLRFEWSLMDAWLEEDEEVFVHPHDPYKRIDILRGSRHVEVVHGGVTLAETRRPTVLFETGAPVRYYIPQPDVRMDLLAPTDTRTGCAYKGFARYWRLASAHEEEIAWSYATPLPDSVKIAGLIAFYDERVDVLVDGKKPKR